MKPFESSWNPQSSEAQARQTAMLARMQALRALEERAAQASTKSQERFDIRGQLLPRQRVALLLDVGAPWLPLSALACVGVGWLVNPGQMLVIGLILYFGLLLARVWSPRLDRAMRWVGAVSLDDGDRGASGLPAADGRESGGPESGGRESGGPESGGAGAGGLESGDRGEES